MGIQYRESSYAEGVWDVFWFETNLQGDVVAIYANEVKLVSYAYSAYGVCSYMTENSIGDMIAEKNSLTYRGYYYDNDLDLYYLGTRYYDPKICRFISPDKYASTGQGILGSNMYAYCNNNPVNMVDDSGALPSWITGLCEDIMNTMDRITIYTTRTIDKHREYFVGGYEIGAESSSLSETTEVEFFTSYTTVVTNTENTDVSLIAGAQFNIGDGGVALETDWRNAEAIVSCQNYSLGLMVGVDKIGVTFKSGVDFQRRTADYYGNFYFNTEALLAAAVVVTVAYGAWRVAPALGVGLAVVA